MCAASARAGTDPAARPAAPDRRQFIAGSLGALGGATLFGLGAGLVASEAHGLPADAVRPPGALAEDRFTAACVRCGLCVRDCPFDTLKLGRLGDGVGPGTPYFTARQVPCEMCEDIPCVKACPTGALDPALKDIDDARMGLAVLADQETCLNFLGLRCDVCYRVCPLIDRAITIESRRNPRSDRHALLIPTVHSEACTGCGKCEHACVLEEAAIKVFPLTLAKGRLGSHYRKSWEEKAKAGRSLIEEMPTPEVRRPGAAPGMPAAAVEALGGQPLEALGARSGGVAR
jgi:ferredoxin-type protein NapG